jgi:hypothetical protein
MRMCHQGTWWHGREDCHFVEPPHDRLGFAATSPEPCRSRGRKSGSGWLFWLAAVAGFGLFGCASDKNELTPPPQDSMRGFVRQARPTTDDIECKGISSKAHEIEADLGARQPDP